MTQTYYTMKNNKFIKITENSIGTQITEVLPTEKPLDMNKEMYNILCDWYNRKTDKCRAKLNKEMLMVIRNAINKYMNGKLVLVITKQCEAGCHYEGREIMVSTTSIVLENGKQTHKDIVVYFLIDKIDESNTDKYKNVVRVVDYTDFR